MTRILSLDQSGVCGFCYGEIGSRPGKPVPGSNAGPPVSGSQRFSNVKQTSERFAKFEAWLIDLVQGNGIDEIVFEEPISGPQQNSFQSRLTLYGYPAVIGIAAYKCKILSFMMPMQSWRSEIGAPTQAPKRVPKDKRREWVKASTIARCQQLGFAPADDNEADAVGLWLAWTERRARRAAAPKFDLFAGVDL